MKHMVLIATLAVAPFLAPLGHPVSEAAYALVTNCQGYQPWDAGFYTVSCDQ